MLRRQDPRTILPLEMHPPCLDRRHARIPAHSDRPVLQSILQVGQHPGLDVLVEARPEVHERHLRPMPPEIERRLGRRVPAADDDRLALERLMPLAVQVRHVREVLTRHAEWIGRTEVPTRDDDRPRARLHHVSAKRTRVDDELVLAPPDVHHRLVLVHVEPEVRHHFAVVRQRLAPRRLVGRQRERHVGDRDLVGRREERHVDGVRGDRTRHARTIEDGDRDPRLLYRRRRCEAAGPRADHDHWQWIVPVDRATDLPRDLGRGRGSPLHTAGHITALRSRLQTDDLVASRPHRDILRRALHELLDPVQIHPRQLRQRVERACIGGR